MKMKRWQVILLLLTLFFIGIANVFSRYFESNPMLVSVWFNRLTGDKNFHLQNIEFKTPEGCLIDSAPQHELSIIGFLCAVAPRKFESVSIDKATFSSVEDAKKYTEKYIDRGLFIYMVIGPKQGATKFPIYYLKHQNVIVFSESNDLAEKFVNELLRYDFRIESEISVDQGK